MMPVVAFGVQVRCFVPAIGPTRVMKRPPSPPYQPIRKMSAVKSCAGLTLTWNAIVPPLFTLVADA